MTKLILLDSLLQEKINKIGRRLVDAMSK